MGNPFDICRACGYRRLDLLATRNCSECGRTRDEAGDFVERRRRFRVRAFLIVGMVGSSWGLGLVGGFLVWNVIYGIGSRVIDDDTHYQLNGTVIRWAGIAGLTWGLVATLLLRRPAPAVVLPIHALAVLAGCVSGEFGWRTGLQAYFSVYGLSTVLICSYAAFVWATRLRRRIPGSPGHK